MTKTFHFAGQLFKITTEHPASSYGIPILLWRGEPIGIDDKIQPPDWAIPTPGFSIGQSALYWQEHSSPDMKRPYLSEGRKRLIALLRAYVLQESYANEALAATLEGNKEMSYSGWANYETWNVALWFGNDEGLYNTVIDRLREQGKFKTGEEVAQFVMELLPEGTPDFDKNPARYLKVRWGEIKRAFNEYLD